MSRTLSQFIHRNLTGEQSLKPVVRSYYSDITPNAHYESDVQHNDASSWTNSEPSMDDESAFTASTPARKLMSEATCDADNAQSNLDRDIDASTQVTSEYHPEESSHAESLTVERDASMRDTSEQNRSSQVGHIDESQHSAVFTEYNLENESVLIHQGELKDLEAVSATDSGYDALSKPLKRRDFTKQVAQAILGNDAAYESSPKSPTTTQNGTEFDTQGHSGDGENLEVSVTIRQVTIMSSSNGAEKHQSNWKPPISLSDYLRERQEGKR
ncbi:hypothetical protein [Vibrio sp. YIC-376]|uniref:hypothetical protein n=1 Tax=Vibrio sp. YIC-376 TaxID=3136162 RepID=UPI00402AD300